MNSTDMIYMYAGVDGWGRTVTASYSCPEGATPPRVITRFGCKLKRVESAANVDWQSVAKTICQPVQSS